MKAREVKRQKLVNRYAEKRAALKAAGDQEGFEQAPAQLEPHPSAQPLHDYRTSERIHAPVRYQPYPVPARWLPKGSSPE